MTAPTDPALRVPGTRQTRHRKARDRSVALLLLGIVLLMPPIGAIFLIDTGLLGVPFPLVYIFVVWVLLIAGGAWLVPVLQDGDQPAPDTGAPESAD